jgi:hypothetical protein
MGHNKGNVSQTVIPDTQAGAVVSETKQAEQQQPQPKPNVYQRWNAVLAEVKSIAKLGENTHDNYDYLQATDVLKELRPLLAKHGLVLKTNPLVDKTDDSEYESRSKTTMHFVRIFTEHWLVNCDAPEDCVQLLGIGDAADVSDKALSKARTGALKYVLRDNFLIDGQDVAEAEKQTSERTGPQNKVGQQRAVQPQAQPALRTQEFTGSIAECGEGTSEDGGAYKWFILFNRNDRMFSFDEENFQQLDKNRRVHLLCTERVGRQGKMFWVVKEIISSLSEQFAGQEANKTNGAEAKPAIVRESAATILKRMFPEAKDVKRKRLVELSLNNQPESLHARILQSFERRIASEKPSSETGFLSCLDISITAVTEEAAGEAEGLFADAEGVQ